MKAFYSDCSFSADILKNIFIAVVGYFIKIMCTYGTEAKHIYAKYCDFSRLKNGNFQMKNCDVFSNIFSKRRTASIICFRAEKEK